jgi:type IV pilus assembly protein PilM
MVYFLKKREIARMGSSKKGSQVYFFKDKPLFGLDIGRSSLRVMQLELERHKAPRLKGYGSVVFDPSAIVDGVIVKPELVSRAALSLFRRSLIGDITTDRVAVSLPANHAYTRAVLLPKISPADIVEAVQAEAEQYIPGHADNLYLDYSVVRESEDGIEAFIVAMPKAIVDSYLVLTKMLGLEAVLFDISVGASARLFSRDPQSAVPSLLVDFGTDSTDITVFNKSTVALGTANFGGEDITRAIARKLKVTPAEALILKSRYGLTASTVRPQILAAIEPSLDLLIKEIRRTIRYYEQRYIKEPPIGQIVTMGGGANMPGLTEYLTDRLRISTRSFDPAPYIDFGHLKHFYNADRATYVTAAGLALTDPKEIFVV